MVILEFFTIFLKVNIQKSRFEVYKTNSIEDPCYIFFTLFFKKVYILNTQSS